MPQAFAAISILILLVGCKARSTGSDEKSIYEYSVLSDRTTVGPVSNQEKQVTVVRCPTLAQFEELRKSANGKPNAHIIEQMGACKFLLTDRPDTTDPKFFSSDEVARFKKFCIERCRDRNDHLGHAPIAKYDKDFCALNLGYVFSPVANGTYLKENVRAAEDVLLTCYKLYPVTDL